MSNDFTELQFFKLSSTAAGFLVSISYVSSYAIETSLWQFTIYGSWWSAHIISIKLSNRLLHLWGLHVIYFAFMTVPRHFNINFFIFTRFKLSEILWLKQTLKTAAKLDARTWWRIVKKPIDWTKRKINLWIWNECQCFQAEQLFQRPND